VVVEGSGPDAEQLLRTARRTWHPNAWVFRGHPPPPFSLPDEAATGPGGGGVRALVCFGSSCGPPVTDPAALRALLERGPSAGAG
jgi:uncharacterized protein YyaL (SSP411 family)